jgi:Fe-S-cluster containining protein
MKDVLNLLYRRKQLTEEQEHEICMKCQFCCRWIGYHVPLAANGPNYYTFAKTWGIKSTIDGDVVHFWIPFPCQHIRDDKCCTIYDKRPEICRKYRGGDAKAGKDLIPYCGWYEQVSDEEKFKILRTIEWTKPVEVKTD